MYNFKMQGNVSMNDHLNAFNQIVRELTSFGESLKDEDVAVALINSLGDRYEHLITTIVHGKDSIGYNEVSAALLEYASRRKLVDGGDSNGDASYFARGRSSSRNSGGGSRGRSQNRFRDVECYYCKQKGHIKPHCQKLKEKLKNDALGGDATIARFDEVDGEVYVVNDDGQAYQHGWVMDSACSVHICIHRNWFSSFRPVNKGVVKLGDDHPRKILGVGTVKIKLHDGTTKTLSGVRYVPGMSKNLISLPILDRIGCRFSGCDGRLDVLRGALVVMRASLQGSLYCLHGNTIVGDLAAGVHRVWGKQIGDRKGQAKRVSFKVEPGRALQVSSKTCIVTPAIMEDRREDGISDSSLGRPSSIGSSIIDTVVVGSSIATGLVFGTSLPYDEFRARNALDSDTMHSTVRLLGKSIEHMDLTGAAVC